MQRKAIGSVIVFVLLGALAVSQAQQAQESYLDVFTVHVKPEKRAEFDAIGKKIAAANRQNKGDTWVAMETVYGPGDRVTFVSTRNSYGEVETAMGSFMGAMQKSLGKAGTDKLFQDLSQCTASSRSEIRRRRWDLSSNAPSDPAALSKMIAEARWLRTTAIHVRPGEAANFEAMLKEVKAAREKASPPVTVLVSQAVAGQEGTVYYSTVLQSSLAGFDALPTMRQLLGDDGYAKFLKTNAETVSNTETAINRFLPDLSNAPEQVAAAAPDFWRPKATVVANAKGPTKAAMTNAADTSKMDDKDKKH
jgi:antibiotic biosynthesis monooxygenase (ABM) superfamily enzyme